MPTPKKRRDDDEEEVTPKRRRASDDEDDEDVKPKRRRASDDDDEDDRPKKRRASSDEDDDDERATGGWGGVARRKKESEARAKESEGIKEFWLKEDEDAIVQFLDDEPVCVDGHSIKDDRGNWDFQVCQLEAHKHCLMCRAGIKKTWKAAFKILDMRGEWDKDKKKYKNNKPIEKLWYVNQTAAEQLHALKDKKKRNLSEMVIEVSRTGSGKATAYNFAVALDEDDKRIPTVEWEPKYPSTKKLAVPLDDETLEAKGFSAP